MKKSLIVSVDTYSWIKYCTGRIIKDPKNFSILIVCADDEKSILGCEKLCSNAIYAQRSYDLNIIGEKLGLRKIANLLYDSIGEDIYKLTAQLQLNILIGGISVIYFQEDEILRNIFKSLKKNIDIEYYEYGHMFPSVDDIAARLDSETVDKKMHLNNYMIGINNENQLCRKAYIEYFNKL